ncbi:MAG: YHYH protein, partial [Flavobacteriia bacterium]|nr:YHYH protein [Flavobacteriia bacterium]
DNNYFYVESKGIPTTHTMMVGISNHGWQQQVPIPQCYTGNNHWSIPLNPIIATTPVPVNASHFTRGAIALAINGVPIFNPFTNTGVDAFLDGQLDNFGGHCGRGDDYHYHTAPLHLYNQTTSSLPIAYALDGFAVYGSLEPDGTAMTSLDINHGHFLNGVYHYHGTASAPYMIKNMVGQVTEDATLEIVPQAHAQPVRTENWGPLSGALITSCTENASNNGYNLSYTLNNASPYATNYSWNGTAYTFNYVTPSGTTTTNYNGFLQCNLALAINNLSLLNQSISIYPNPSSDILNINLGTKLLEKDVKSISIYDLKGTEIFHSALFKSSIDTKKFNRGTYIIKIQVSNSSITKRFFVN